MAADRQFRDNSDTLSIEPARCRFEGIVNAIDLPTLAAMVSTTACGSWLEIVRRQLANAFICQRVPHAAFELIA